MQVGKNFSIEVIQRLKQFFGWYFKANLFSFNFFVNPFVMRTCSNKYVHLVKWLKYNVHIFYFTSFM